MDEYDKTRLGVGVVIILLGVLGILVAEFIDGVHGDYTLLKLTMGFISLILIIGGFRQSLEVCRDQNTL